MRAEQSRETTDSTLPGPGDGAPVGGAGTQFEEEPAMTDREATPSTISTEEQVAEVAVAADEHTAENGAVAEAAPDTPEMTNTVTTETATTETVAEPERQAA